MQQVTIIGLGLIGGSIGLGLSQWSRENGNRGEDALRITGFDSDIEQQQYAKKLHAVDRTEWELARAIRGADLIVICVPVREIRQVFLDIRDHLKPGAIVTDTASTKREVLDWANELLLRTVSFVGGHPMAGKSQSIEGAEAGLFKGATWCVCPSVHASEDAIKNVLGMINALGAEPYFIDPVEHDAHVAGVSHLPFVLSAALMRTTSEDPSWRDMKTLSASGFRDMTRLAGGSPSMHRDIALTNRDSLVRWIDQMTGELNAFKVALNDDDPEKALTAYFAAAQDARAAWATQTSREGELQQDTEDELSNVSMSGQMGRMLFGSLLGRRRFERDDAKDKAPKARPDRV